MDEEQTEAPYTGFYIRLRPRARKLLDQATEAQGRSRMAIIHDLIHRHLEPQRSLEDRLDQLIRGRQ